MHAWQGNSSTTLFMNIENSLEWDLIRSGSKTEIRSPKPLLNPDVTAPVIVMLHHDGNYAPFVIADIWKEELSSVDVDDAKAEGFDSLAAFKRHWCSKTNSHHFSNSERVWGYSFAGHLDTNDLFDGDEDTYSIAVRKVVEALYPPAVS